MCAAASPPLPPRAWTSPRVAALRNAAWEPAGAASCACLGDDMGDYMLGGAYDSSDKPTSPAAQLALSAGLVPTAVTSLGGDSCNAGAAGGGGELRLDGAWTFAATSAVRLRGDAAETERVTRGFDELTHMAAAVNAALSCGAAAPVRMGGESLGGTYCLPASAPRENFVGVFKPADEEPFAPNNPRAASGRALGAPGARRGVLTGEGFVREAAAFLLDTGGFAAVPPTAVGTLRHGALSHVDAASSADEPKLGSLQDVGPDLFPTRDVHAIAILDIRTANCDRNEGNILVVGYGGGDRDGSWGGAESTSLVVCADTARRGRSGAIASPDAPRTWVAVMRSLTGPPMLAPAATPGAPLFPGTSGRRAGEGGEAGRGRSVSALLRGGGRVRLVPIDHGLILPHVGALDEVELAWLGWRAAGEPWSAGELAYIAALDGAADAALLGAAGGSCGGLRPESLVTLRACTLLLQRGAAAGLTAREIGGFLVRNGDSPVSRMELCVAAALAGAAAAAAGGGEASAFALLEHLDEPLAAHIGAVLAARDAAGSRARARTVS